MRESASSAESMPEALRVGTEFSCTDCPFEDAEGLEIEGLLSSCERSRVPRDDLIGVDFLDEAFLLLPLPLEPASASSEASWASRSAFLSATAAFLAAALSLFVD